MFWNIIIKYGGYLWLSHVTIATFNNLYRVGKRSVTNGFEKFVKKQLLKQRTEILFLPDTKIACRHFLNEAVCDEKHCGYAHEETSLSKLIKSLSSAKSHIDVCIFTISSQDLADIIIKKHKEGIIVRVVTDYERMDSNCSQIEQFRASGIQVRHDRTSYFMHHKFAIVDHKLLINGSFNWTKQAITGNQENVMITDVDNLVQPYTEQFEKLWKLYNVENQSFKKS